MRYYVWCDESIRKGKHFSNFYGGILVKSTEFEYIKKQLESITKEFEKFGEVKWTKITSINYKEYIKLVDKLFDFIQEDIVKIRIMFTSNRFKAKNLSSYHKDHHYHLLYYQFLKHAFGLRQLSGDEPHHLEIFFDKLPDTEEKNKKFIEYIHGLQYLPSFIDANIKIQKFDIAEIDSSKHIFMQCLDVVLGAMNFKLNKSDKEIDPISGRRGKRTLAKFKVYKQISKRIRNIYPNFNLSITTGKKNGMYSLWEDPYRHWCFMPKEFEQT